jgi:hypothetical protein
MGEFLQRPDERRHEGTNNNNNNNAGKVTNMVWNIGQKGD